MSHSTLSGVGLDELFPGARALGRSGVRVQGCTCDWRRVQPGDAFVAVTEDGEDGHDRVGQALARGAAAVIAERLVPAFEVPVFVVEDSREALGALCHELAGNPSHQIRVIGVVGTQGKSTVAALLESIFTAAGCEVGMLSGLKSYDGMTRGPGVDRQLSPMLLAARLARMEASGCTHAIVELSSQALAQRKTAGMHFDAVVATCVESGNLEFHNSPKNYRRAVRRAFDQLASEGLAVLNADDPTSCRWLAEMPAPSLTYGVKADAQVTAEIIEQNACETVFLLTAGCESAAVRTTIVGDHHVANCLAAATVALARGIELETICRGIESLNRLPARMERVDCGQEFVVFVDAAENPTALRASLRTARRLSRGRVICVLGERPAASPSDAFAVHQVARKMADLTIVTDSVASAHQSWTEHDAAEANLHVAADRGEAMAWALAAADPGDVVVLAGSRGGCDWSFGEAEPADADAVRELLYAAQSPSSSSLRIAG